MRLREMTLYQAFVLSAASNHIGVDYHWRIYAAQGKFWLGAGVMQPRLFIEMITDYPIPIK